jgi:hypothetical protein
LHFFPQGLNHIKTNNSAAKGKNGRARVLVTRYDNDNNDNNDTKLRDLRIKVDEIADGAMLAYLTDDCHSYTEIPLQVNDGAVNLYKPEST